MTVTALYRTRILSNVSFLQSKFLIVYICVFGVVYGVCMYMCVFLCVREKKRGRGREGDLSCVCMACMCVCSMCVEWCVCLYVGMWCVCGPVCGVCMFLCVLAHAWVCWLWHLLFRQIDNVWFMTFLLSLWWLRNSNNEMPHLYSRDIYFFENKEVCFH